MKQRQALHYQDRRQEAQQKLEALLLEGLNSGDPVEATPQFLEQRRQRLVGQALDGPAPRSKQRT